MILPDDAVRPLTEEERQLYKVLSGVIQTPASVLSAKWREPSLTIHDVRASSATSEFIFTYDPFAPSLTSFAQTRLSSRHR